MFFDGSNGRGLPLDPEAILEHLLRQVPRDFEGIPQPYTGRNDQRRLPTVDVKIKAPPKPPKKD